MLDFVDNFLNRVTMYRLTLYVLLALLGAAFVLSFLGILRYSPQALLFSTLAILAVCWAVNNVFAAAFKVPANVESVYITWLILTFLIAPPAAGIFSTASFIFWASVWAMASKFIFAVKRKHIWNPAAFGVAVTAVFLNQSANWWVGDIHLLPVVLLGGFLIVRKISRFDLVLPFFAAAFVSVGYTTLAKGANLGPALQNTLFNSPFFFFASVMLTEPLTSPPTRRLRVAYGALVGILFAPAVHFGSLYSTPELALLAGNVFSYLASPKRKLLLSLKEKTRLSPDIFDFAFATDAKIKFRPGQYLEWTLGHSPSDGRGNRRYFTIASSPTENELHMGVKFYPSPSTFKRALYSLPEGGQVMAGQLAGDFVLPRDKNEKLAFVAGGIGVTPYRSMVKYLLDKNEARDVVILYSARTADDFAYTEIFEEARRRLGVKTLYMETGKNGPLTPEVIKQELPDWRERTFYLSGPRSMVVSFEEALRRMGVPGRRVKTDFFPGFA